MFKFSNQYAYLAALGAGCLLSLVLTGCNKNQDPDVTIPATTVGTEIDDSIITTRVKAALLSDQDSKGLDIKVTTDKGVVMLSGFADTQTQIDRSVAVAKGVEGVKRVNNQLSLHAGKSTIGSQVDDSVITARVKSALLADPLMKSLDVSVVTNKGEVQLSGFVDNQAQLTRAVEITKAAEGVSSVVNHLSLKK